MIFHYTLRGSIQVPEGSSLNETGSGILLPDGWTLQLWEGWEIHLNGEDHKGINYDELTKLDYHYEGEMAEYEW